MKKLIMAFTFLIMGTAFSNDLSAQCRNHKSIRAEQSNQHKRIKHGKANGELTHRESARLRAQQAHIQREKRRAKADGIVTPAERRHIKSDQARASRNIYRQKHDSQYR
jgi:hypothetical protein